MESVYDFLENLSISSSKTLIVGVSYGPDSMALLDILCKYYPNNKIICAHVHHNHRKESDEEVRKLEYFCKLKNITFEFMKIDSYENNRFTEQEAREKRYAFFENLINKYDSNYLFTAHHGDDLIETVLMRIVRGSSLKGYAGISLISKRKNYNIIRPLLFVTKDELLNYCDKNSLNYAIDKSNDDDTYTRNRYRKYILPLLKKENPFVHRQFLKFSTLLDEYNSYFDSIIDKLYPNIVVKNEILVDKLLMHDNLIIKKIVMRYLYNNYGSDITYIDDNKTNLVISLIKSKKPNELINLVL